MKLRFLSAFCAALLGLAGLLAGTALAQDAPAPSPAAAPASGTLLELPGAPAAPQAAPSSPPPPIAASAPPAPPLAMPAIPPAPQMASPAPAAPAAAPSVPPPLMNATPPPVMPPHAAPVSTAPLPPAPPQASPTMPAPAPVAAGGASQQSVTDMLSKNQEVLFAPMHIAPDLSLAFKKTDMNVITEALAVYDKSVRTQKQEASGNDDHDLTSLLTNLKTDNNTPQEAPPPLPNLYLGSIVYYTPSHWSIWVNSRKVTNLTNQRDHEIFVTRLSKNEVELIWKPISLLDTAALWQRLTDNGAHPLPRVRVDERNGTITLVLRTNQTFIPRTLDIREGLVKSMAVTSAAPPGTPDFQQAGAPMAQQSSSPPYLHPHP